MVFDDLQRMAQAVEQGWCAAWASLGAMAEEPRTIVDETPEFLRVYTPGIPETLLNIVMRYAARSPAAGPVTSSDVERVIAPYRAHRLPLQWWLLLGAEPAGLRDALRESGMRSWGGSPTMTAVLDDAEPHYTPPPRGVEFGRVSTPDDERDTLAVVSHVYYLAPGPMRRWWGRNPAFRVYAARWQGRVVAAMTTMIVGESVGVYNVATLPGARRRGIGGNLVLYALREARSAGCTLATLTATPEARRLYEQLGFRACGVIEQWMPSDRLMKELTGQSDPYGAW